MRSILCAALLISIVTAIHAQQRSPPRDQPPKRESKGTASIRGRVFAADTGRPLRRARITATAPELSGEPRNISTDADGRYELTELPAGRYTLRAARGGYLTLRYGQRRPLEQGKPLQLLDSQGLEDVNFSLPKMSILAGRVTDETGDPIEGVEVYAVRSMYFNSRRQLVPSGQDRSTDDSGGFRIRDLAPGNYYVVAKTRETWSVLRNGIKQVMGYAPTYFPGTTQIGQASRVTLKVGEEIRNLELSLVPGRAARLSGTALDSRGQPYRTVVVSAEVRGDQFSSFGTVARGTVGSDGTFYIPSIPPGDYMLEASTGRDSPNPDVALLPITVDGIDIENISLTGSTGGTITGRVMTEDGIAPALPRLSVSVTEITSGQANPMLIGAFRNPGGSEVAADGTFTIKGIFGRPRLRMTLPDGWALKSAVSNGRDIADDVLELRDGETLSNVDIVITNRVGTVGGQLVDDKNAPLTDGTVIIFAVDSAKWSDGSRFIRAVRPDQQGRWQVKGLPSGEYLGLAVDYVEDGSWFEPDYLEAVRRYGVKLSLREAETTTLALKMIQPQ